MFLVDDAAQSVQKSTEKYYIKEHSRKKREMHHKAFAAPPTALFPTIFSIKFQRALWRDKNYFLMQINNLENAQFSVIAEHYNMALHFSIIRVSKRAERSTIIHLLGFCPLFPFMTFYFCYWLPSFYFPIQNSAFFPVSYMPFPYGDSMVLCIERMDRN